MSDADDGFYKRDPNVFTMFTIFCRPADFPTQYVVRRFDIVRERVIPTPFYRLAETLEEARRHVPQGLWPVERSGEDKTSIVESWI